jgi:hypothetical protein
MSSSDVLRARATQCYELAQQAENGPANRRFERLGVFLSRRGEAES